MRIFEQNYMLIYLDIEDLPLTKKVIQDGREFNSAEVHGTIQNNIISAK